MLIVNSQKTRVLIFVATLISNVQLPGYVGDHCTVVVTLPWVNLPTIEMEKFEENTYNRGKKEKNGISLHLARAVPCQISVRLSLVPLCYWPA
jgi:hypothetical protein